MKISFVPKNDIASDPVNRMRCYNVIKGLLDLGCQAGMYKGKNDYDILVVLSLDFDRWLPVLKENKLRGQLTIFDLSDNEFARTARLSMGKIMGIKRYLFNLKEIRSRMRGYKHRKTFDRGLYPFVQGVDFVTVSSSVIYDSVIPLNANCCFIPEAIDLNIYKGGKIHQDKKDISIVWVGMCNNVIFLEQLNKALCRLQQEFNLRVKVISSPDAYTFYPSIKWKLRFKYEFIDWDLSTVNDHLMEADIGVAVLGRKALWPSANKIATYWLAGLPVVVSPSPEYDKTVTHGENGYIVRSSGDWYRYLKKLILNSRLREEFSSKGRAYAERVFSIRNVARQWLELFEKLIGEQEHKELNQ